MEFIAVYEVPFDSGPILVDPQMNPLKVTWTLESLGLGDQK